MTAELSEALALSGATVEAALYPCNRLPPVVLSAASGYCYHFHALEINGTIGL